MKILYVHCHPLPDSFHGALRSAAIGALAAKGHSTDLLDLYAEGFQPALTAEQRRRYLDSPQNEAELGDMVARLKAAEVLIVQFPVWCFGPPAMLKGFFDRLLLPGVAYDPKDSKPSLGNLQTIVGVVTYGQPWTAAFWMGDAPRKTVTRFLPWFTGGRAKTEYLALYGIDASTDTTRKAFIGRVERSMARL